MLLSLGPRPPICPCRGRACEYVRICTEYGVGFSTSRAPTLPSVGGRVRAEYLYQETFNRRENAIGFLARAD